MFYYFDVKKAVSEVQNARYFTGPVRNAYLMIPGDWEGAWEIFSKRNMHMPRPNRNNLCRIGGVYGSKDEALAPVVVINFSSGKVLYKEAYWVGDDDVTKYMTEEDETFRRFNRMIGKASGAIGNRD